MKLPAGKHTSRAFVHVHTPKKKWISGLCAGDTENSSQMLKQWKETKARHTVPELNQHPWVLVPCHPINLFICHKFTACLPSTWPGDTSGGGKCFVFPSTLDIDSRGRNIKAVMSPSSSLYYNSFLPWF